MPLGISCAFTRFYIKGWISVEEVPSPFSQCRPIKTQHWTSNILMKKVGLSGCSSPSPHPLSGFSPLLSHRNTELLFDILKHMTKTTFLSVS